MDDASGVDSGPELVTGPLTVVATTADAAADAVRLDDLEALFWSHPRHAADEARAWLDALGDGDRSSTSMRLTVLLTAIRIRNGEIDASAVALSEALRWASEHDDAAVAVRCHRLLASLFDRLNDASLTLQHALAANEMLRGDESALTRAVVFLSLADAFGTNAVVDKSRIWYAASAELVGQIDALDLELLIINNQAYTEYLHGDIEVAAALVEDLIRRSKAHDRSLKDYDRDTIASVWIATGRLAEAAEMLAPYDRLTSTSTSRPDAVAMCLLTLTQLHRRRADYARAQRALDWCRLMCERHNLASSAVEVAREQAEIHAGRGDFENAFASHKEFHHRYTAHRTVISEAHARTLQVMFDTTQARRDSEHFRELAEHDPLTGLYNRRYVDDRLPGLLADTGRSVAVALVDLDRFKQINDSRSHEAGDDVLRGIAGLLAEAASMVDGGIAARMGGEEFLLIWPGVDEQTTMTLLEQCRAAIAGHPWQDIVGDIAVTASIGCALAPNDSSNKRELMSTADSRLYRAKSLGRNRVVGPAVRGLDSIAG